MRFIFELWNYLTSIFIHLFFKVSLNILGLQSSPKQEVETLFFFFFLSAQLTLEFSCSVAHSGACLLLWDEPCMQSEVCLNTVGHRILCICPMGSNYTGILTVQTCAAPLWNYAVFNRPENFSFLTCGRGVWLAVSVTSPTSTKKAHYAGLSRVSVSCLPQFLIHFLSFKLTKCVFQA